LRRRWSVNSSLSRDNGLFAPLELSVMTKSLVVLANTNLEIFFTCIVLDVDHSVRMKNPVLQMMYDDVRAEAGRHLRGQDLPRA
jgi:hypothetical protein